MRSRPACKSNSYRRRTDERSHAMAKPDKAGTDAMTRDYDIKDPGLARIGESRVEWAARHMPVL